MDRTFADCLRVGHGYDVHALAPGLRLRLCGVDLEHDRGCVAHSDGDVAVHALCDALLGAAALGDIGLHFPDTAAEYAGIDSMVLLERCMELLAGEGFGVVNADVTIAMQRPRLRPHIDAMRRRLAAALQVDLSRVSVKATTTERLGFVGCIAGKLRPQGCIFRVFALFSYCGISLLVACRGRLSVGRAECGRVLSPESPFASGLFVAVVYVGCYFIRRPSRSMKYAVWPVRTSARPSLKEKASS